ncbi:MAG: hypothetical protein GX298_08410 [Planctomycetes bacterium]|nr:hypothetical protein [Planctomycetota bacterium]
MHLKVIMILVGGVLFLVSTAGYIYAKLRLRPDKRSDLDAYYYEFEDQHPDLARYNRWCRITWGGIIAAMLLLFLSLVL